MSYQNDRVFVVQEDFDMACQMKRIIYDTYALIKLVENNPLIEIFESWVAHRMGETGTNGQRALEDFFIGRSRLRDLEAAFKQDEVEAYDEWRDHRTLGKPFVTRLLMRAKLCASNLGLLDQEKPKACRIMMHTCYYQE